MSFLVVTADVNCALNSDAATIARHPRNITSTVRREDTTRKDARERRKERKAEEIARRTEEVKRLKALKMREIRKRLDLVGKEGGIQGAEGAHVLLASLPSVCGAHGVCDFTRCRFGRA